MAHNPVNHPARPVYRAIGGLSGLYLVIFGVLGVLATSGAEFFAQEDVSVLGQGTNLAYSVLAVLLGLLVLVGTGVGRNIDTIINKALGYGLMVLGLAALAVLRTDDANYLNFSIITVIVTMIMGLVLLMTSLYGRVGSDEESQAWQEARLLL